MTFFAAPLISTPARSVLKYTLSVGWCNSRATRFANPASPAASVSAVGRPWATSSAKLGPDKAPNAAPFPSASAAT